LWSPVRGREPRLPRLPAYLQVRNGEQKANYANLIVVDEGRKRVLLIAASILAARKLAQYDSGARIPATVAAIADGVRWAERIMEEIDRRHPEKPAQQPRAS